ncbi:MAG TPA: transposase [Vicinamibacterales bacterium]|nr:transposase [Vicinamibacterales bacterium]
MEGIAFHVMNRSVRGSKLFLTNRDFEAFASVVCEGLDRSQGRVRILSFQVLDNHWHFAITCDRIADLSNYMHWMEGTHANRWAGAHNARGRGYVYQGRFRAVPVQTSTSLVRVCRYIERNALRKNLVGAAEQWAWGSLYAQCNNFHVIPLSPWPIPQPENWIELVNTPQTEAELRDLRKCIKRDQPIGDLVWAKHVSSLLGLTMRPVGRPKKN